MIRIYFFVEHMVKTRCLVFVSAGPSINQFIFFDILIKTILILDPNPNPAFISYSCMWLWSRSWLKTKQQKLPYCWHSFQGNIQSKVKRNHPHVIERKKPTERTCGRHLFFQVTLLGFLKASQSHLSGSRPFSLSNDQKWVYFTASWLDQQSSVKKLKHWLRRNGH